MSEAGTVLLVDDNEATCTLIRAVLRSAFEVDSAADGAEAISKLKARSYSAILLDLKLPHVDGYEVLDFMEKEMPQVTSRVLIVTAALSERELQRLAQYRVCGMIRKPFDVDQLLSAVQKCAADDPDLVEGPRSDAIFGPVMILLADFLRHRFPFN